jgi:hypothetical protein
VLSCSCLPNSSLCSQTVRHARGSAGGRVGALLVKGKWAQTGFWCGSQVYLANWNRSQVAVKLLLRPEAHKCSPQDAADLLLSSSNPVLERLQEVRSSHVVQHTYPKLCADRGDQARIAPHGTCLPPALEEWLAHVRSNYILCVTQHLLNFRVSAGAPALFECMQEAGTMAALRHPHVLQFLGIVILPPCVVSEYCSRGSLCNLLNAAKTSPVLQKQLTWQRRLKMVSSCSVS